MSTIRSVDDIFHAAYPKLCLYAEACNIPKYSKQVKWAQRTYFEQFEEEDVPVNTEDRDSILGHLVSVEKIMKSMTEKTQSLEDALREHREEVNAVHVLFDELQRTVGVFMHRLEEKQEARKRGLSSS